MWQLQSVKVLTTGACHIRCDSETEVQSAKCVDGDRGKRKYFSRTYAHNNAQTNI